MADLVVERLVKLLVAHRVDVLNELAPGVVGEALLNKVFQLVVVLKTPCINEGHEVAFATDAAHSFHELAAVPRLGCSKEARNGGGGRCRSGSGCGREACGP